MGEHSLIIEANDGSFDSFKKISASATEDAILTIHSAEDIQKIVQNLREKMNSLFSHLERSFYTAKKNTYMFNPLSDPLSFQEKSLYDFIAEFQQTLDQADCREEELLLELKKLPESLNQIAKVQMARLRAGLFIHNLHILEQDIDDLKLKKRRGEKEEIGAEKMSAATLEALFPNLEIYSQKLSAQLSMPIEGKDSTLIDDLAHQYLRHLTDIQDDLKTQVARLKKRSFTAKPAGKRSLFISQPGKIFTGLKSFFSNRWYIQSKSLIEITLQEIRNIQAVVSNPSYEHKLMFSVASAGLKIAGGIPQLALNISSIYSSFKRSYNFKKGIDKQKREIKRLQAEINKLSEEDPLASEEAKKMTLSQVKTLILELEIAEKELKKLNYKLIFESLAIGNGFRKTAGNVLSLVLSTISLLRYAVNSATVARGIAPFLAIGGAIGQTLGAIGLAISGIQLGFNFRSLFRTFRKEKILHRQQRDLDEIISHLATEEKLNKDAPLSKKHLLLEQLAIIEKQRLFAREAELNQRKKRQIIGIAATSIMTAGAILGFAAAFTHGTTLAILGGVSVGICLSAFGFMIYDHIKAKKLKKENEQLSLRFDVTHQSMRQLAHEMEIFTDLDDRELRLAAKILHVKKEVLLLKPEYFLKTHFKKLLSELDPK